MSNPLDSSSKFYFSRRCLLSILWFMSMAVAVYLYVSTVHVSYLGEAQQLSNDIPESVIDADSNNPASIALALTALVARPTFGELSPFLVVV